MQKMTINTLSRQSLTKIVMVLAALMVIAAGETIFAYPAVAAVACPACYGLDRMDTETFVERGMTAEDRANVRIVIAEARRRVGAFYGSFTSNPRILVCSTESCYRHIGGHRERGKSFFDFALILSPRGLGEVIVSHELSHVELHHRLGFFRSLTNAVPAWFNEGVAVVVADDRRYLAPVDAPNRCLVRSDGPLPNTTAEWNRAAGERDSKIYAESACRVSEWMAEWGGPHAVTNLVSLVAMGKPFSDVYRRPS
jgi:hypothetical protein